MSKKHPETKASKTPSKRSKKAKTTAASPAPVAPASTSIHDNSTAIANCENQLANANENAKNGENPLAIANKTADSSGKQLAIDNDSAKSGKKKLATANDLPSLAEYTVKQRLFVEEYPIDGNGTAAAIRAGYAPSSAATIAYGLLKDPVIKANVEARIEGFAEEVRLSRERVISELEKMATADANELVEFRRTCCRFCWGLDFKYQRTAGEMERDRERHRESIAELVKKDKDGEAILGPFDEKGGVGYRRTKDANPACPECDGEGVGDVHFKDTRVLSPRARAIYAGAKIGKDGIEVKLHSKDAAIDRLAKHHKVYEDKTEVNIGVFDAASLEEKFASKMRAARQRADEVRKERGQKEPAE